LFHKLFFYFIFLIVIIHHFFLFFFFFFFSGGGVRAGCCRPAPAGLLCELAAHLVSPLPVRGQREVVPVVDGFVEAGMYSVGGSRAAGYPARGTGREVPVTVARQGDDGYETAEHSHEEQGECHDRVCPDHADHRFLAGPARAYSVQPRGLPRVAGIVASPGRILGK